MTTDRPTLLERAYQMARAGHHKTISEITLALRAERYENAPSMMSGKDIRRSLRAIIRAAAGKASQADEPTASNL